MTDNSRWLTTTQDEFREPATVKITRYLESEEVGRYQDCMAAQKNIEDDKEDIKARNRVLLCCQEQNENREPVYLPNDYHINPTIKHKPTWCRCLATGDPNCYDEIRAEKEAEELCQGCYNQMDPTPENNRQKVYSTTNFIDYRDPAFPYIHNKIAIKNQLDEKFKKYKARVDAIDALKEPKITAQPPDPDDRVDPNCLCLFEDLPEGKFNRSWKADERWWREETDDCRKGIVKKYIWTTTYREMNKDGAALPLAVHELPASCIERPPGDPLKRQAEMAPTAMMPLGEVFEKWDRPQVRKMAGRCDTMYNRPPLGHDSYFQERRLCRTKYARCSEGHDVPTRENMQLVRNNMLRQPYDRMIPGYGGYECKVTPPICKVKKILNPADPYDNMSQYQANFTMHPIETYEDPVKPIKPSDFDKMGIATNPISTLGRIPLPEASRLSCYLE